MSDNREGYPGSGDGGGMAAPRSTPSGSPSAGDVSDAVTWSEPIHGDMNVIHPGRFLDPVRAHALEQAAVIVSGLAFDMDLVLDIADRFEAWLGRKAF